MNKKFNKYKLQFIVLTFILAFVQSNAQVFYTQMFSRDTFRIQILSSLPDSFPDVGVIFKAHSATGFPLWNIEKKRVLVQENGEPVEVIKFASLTNEQPLRVMLVLDHSGSMLAEAGQEITMADYYFNREELVRKSPLKKAQNALVDFVNTFDFTKDMIGVVTFNNTITNVVEPTKDKDKILNAINSLEADGGTAYYDAMQKALKVLNTQEGMRFLISLTDGDDNASRVGLNRIVELANQLEIPIYNIGLGNVSPYGLKKMALESQGEFYYAKESKELNQIYNQVRGKMSALYALSYRSLNLASADTNRIIDIRFDIDEAISLTEPFSYYLPAEVREKLMQIEEQKRNEDLLVYIGIGIGAIIGISGLVYLFVRNRREEYYS
jgi:Mg-chelatase subunit ChlD